MLALLNSQRLKVLFKQERIAIKRLLKDCRITISMYLSLQKSTLSHRKRSSWKFTRSQPSKKQTRWQMVSSDKTSQLTWLTWQTLQTKARFSTSTSAPRCCINCLRLLAATILEATRTGASCNDSAVGSTTFSSQLLLQARSSHSIQACSTSSVQTRLSRSNHSSQKVHRQRTSVRASWTRIWC